MLQVDNAIVLLMPIETWLTYIKGIEKAHQLL